MTSEEVIFVRTTFRLDQRDLAKALNVSPATVLRWEAGAKGNAPVGLQEEVLRALHNVALHVQHNEVMKISIAGRIQLGIGALIFYGLTEKLY